MLFKRSSQASRRADPPTIEKVDEDGRLLIRLAGRWITRRVQDVDAEMRRLLSGHEAGSVTLDLSGVTLIDTAGAWMIVRLMDTAETQGAKVEVVGASQSAAVLLDAVGKAVKDADHTPAPRPPNVILRALDSVGRTIYAARDDILAAMNILGATIEGGQMKLGRGHGINFAAIFNQIDRMGVRAIPVILLMSTIVGAIVAQQGAFQLRYFGAEIFVVDLVGILVFRELGVLMTAIMIAGRSGSAITAEIGSMKMREEVDALKVIGLNPVGVLVFPRLVALVVALPCLTILANFAALAGAIGVSWGYSDIPPAAFLDRLRSAVDLGTVFAGLIKAPFMGMIMGTIASV